MRLGGKPAIPNAVPRAVWLSPVEALELAALVEAAAALGACDPRVEMGRQVTRIRARWRHHWLAEWSTE